MLKLWFSSQFKKDLKVIRKRHYSEQKLKNVLAILQREERLPAVYKDHPLIGNWNGFRECHIQSDWLLIYRIDGMKLELVAQRTGSHSDLFKL